MGLRRGPDWRVALGPAGFKGQQPPRGREWWGGLCLNVYLSSASPGPTPIPKGVCRLHLRPQGPPQTLPGPGAKGPQGVLACHILQGPSPS